jgi:hypothetical protein
VTALTRVYGADHAQLVRWVVKTYGIGMSSGGMDLSGQPTNKHRLRRAAMAQRIRLYRDDADQDFAATIDAVFKNESVREQRKALISVASEQNVTRRIIDEVYSLYDKPAVRALAKKDVEFHLEEKRLHLHELTQEYHRLLGLCNEVLIWQFDGVDGKSKLRIVTPDCFDAIPYKNDATALCGVLLEACPANAQELVDPSVLPHWELWDDEFVYLISKRGDIVDENGKPSVPRAHGMDRIPGALLHRREPVDRLLEGRQGRDIVSGHLGCGLLNVMIMRLSKAQGERQPVLQGNLANVAAGQKMDGEAPIILPPEVLASMLDTKTDPDHYLAVKKDKVGGLAQTWGMSYEQVTNAAIDQSGEAFMARRQKLMELRGEQTLRAKTNEAAVVELMGYDPTNMKLDHQEQAIPQDATEEVALLDMKMKLGLDSIVAYLRRKDPDLSEDDALKIVERNLSVYAKLITMVRALNMPAGADASNPGNDPKINGQNKIVTTTDPAALVGGAPTPGAGGNGATTNRGTGTATAA